MIFRPPSAPQVVQFGLAVFLTGASGPGAPQGNNAALQAQIAYRGPANVVAATPKPPNVAATALAVTIGPVAPQGSTAALQAQIAYREPRRVIAEQPEPPTAPYAVVTTGPGAPFGSTAVLQTQIAYRGPARIVEQPAPPNVAATALAVTIGPTTPQGSTASAQARVAYRGPTHNVAQPAPPTVDASAIAGPTVPQGSTSAWQAHIAYRMPPWANAAYEQERLGAVINQGITAVYLKPLPVVLPPVQPWPYAAFSAIEVQPAATVPLQDYIWPSPAPQYTATSWPYAFFAITAPGIAGIAPAAPPDEPSNRYGHRHRDEDLTRTVEKQWELLEARKRAREQPEIVVPQPVPAPKPEPAPEPREWSIDAPELDAVLARVAPGLREELAFKAAANGMRLADLVAILAAAGVFDDE